MSDLQKYIKEHRAEFDDAEPSRRHFDRFEKKLLLEIIPAGQKLRHILQIAASVAIIAAAGWFIFDKTHNGYKVDVLEIPRELRETEDYYIRQITSRYDRIRNYPFQSDQEKAILLDELNDLDIYQQKLMNDLNANPQDERVVNALIRHYQLKLEIMDQIINHLNQIKSQKFENHEKESI
ncbi:MAG: hypothetical protein JXA39_05920 [Bacteroidales bacterium]|nr:hypothetical protein [Bacteroidales bacterium]